MLMIELAQTGGQLAAAGAGSGDHHQRTGGLDIIISAKTVCADDMCGIIGIAHNVVMVIYPDAHALQTGLECLGHGLVMEAGQHHAGNIQTEAAENIDEADHIPVIGNAQVTADLIFLNIVGVDGNDHLHLVLQLQQHPQLAVRLEAGQYPGCMVIVIQLAAKLQIQLAAELGDPVPDVGRLGLQVFIVIKGNILHRLRLFQKNKFCCHYTGIL